MSYKVVEIDSDNVEEYSKFIDQDLQEQLDREFFRGIGAVDDTDTPVGAMVYELLDYDSDEDTKRIPSPTGAVAETASSFTPSSDMK